MDVIRSELEGLAQRVYQRALDDLTVNLGLSRKDVSLIRNSEMENAIVREVQSFLSRREMRSIQS